ncbi:carbamoyltransferase HypF [Mariprofundus ferrooxydans]|uniref:carbamoyltransferase HypF n=1 Tax=Mariprofundus ferrooxydans TaxID=314344 RepID=UPI0014314CD3|nr:carbamoyltransferase HypF [Mariprofundus ferrooxydans]
MAISIRVRGQVQGVGFRPFVWHLATQAGITGSVWNDEQGVLIHAWGDQALLEQFRQHIMAQAPPLARVDAMESSLLPATATAPAAFTIAASRDNGNTHTAITPDAATCPHCLEEILNPAARHYGYPFTSCTHCGPRLSIVRAVPFDRAHTSMAPFQMCADCQSEYDDPAHRRFHAQTNACPACGPHVWLEDRSGNRLALHSSMQVLARAATLIQEGLILAIKGIGGIHLAVDAGNNEAVQRLRTLKQRDDKPFALMGADIDAISRYALIDESELQLLTSSVAPIVLLKRKADTGSRLAEAVAPKQSRLGFMLPYSPLHLLLMRQLKRPIVLTSGNHSNQPQCIDNNEARHNLTTVADFLLLNDRDIVNRLDDSVVTVMAGAPRILRRARGYAPAPLLLHESFAAAPALLAMGGELKSTFCQLADGEAIVSQHLGDLEHAETAADYRHTLNLYAQMFAFKPEAVAVDMHPDYVSTRMGQQVAESSGVALLSVQHHHAHIASVLAEHGMPVDTAPVLGIALDGLGFGDDGTLWGGEFLLADYTGYTRLGCFQPLPMPGGAQAILEPWRNTLAHLHALGWEATASAFSDSELLRFLSAKPLKLLHSMIEKGLNSPLSSSCGRLFDAVAAALDIGRERISYEGQAAIELESLARTAHFPDLSPYPYRLSNDAVVQINWQPMWQALLSDLSAEVERALIAARFHQTVSEAVSVLALQLCHTHEIKSVILCGGAFQNQLLLESISNRLHQSDQQVLIARQMPMNDGGLALGQAAIAAARLLDRE